MNLVSSWSFVGTSFKEGRGFLREQSESFDQPRIPQWRRGRVFLAAIVLPSHIGPREDILREMRVEFHRKMS